MANPMLEMMKEAVGQSMEMAPSPVARWLKGVLRHVEEGCLEAEYEVREEMTNPVGILHGGMVSTIMDDLMGATVYTLGRSNFYTSVNLNVDFLASARLGDKVIARTRLVRAGQTVINAECEVKSESGKLLARCSSNLLRISTTVM